MAIFTYFIKASIDAFDWWSGLFNWKFHRITEKTGDLGPMRTVKAFFLCASVLATACTPIEQSHIAESLPEAETTAQDEMAAEVDVPIQGAVDPASVAPMQALTEREAMYDDVFKQAERQGILLGGMRGALVGALVKGEGGAVAGAILGAIIGSSYSISVADRLLNERDEFLNRQEIIENILNASKLATSRSVEDAELVSRAMTAHALLGDVTHPETHMQVAGAVSTLRRAVELRAIMIEEALLEATPREAEAKQVRLEIIRQKEALRRIRVQQDAWSTLYHD